MSDFKIVSVLNPTVVLTGGPTISANNSSQNDGTIVFSNSNNVSFGFSNGVMTASAAGGGGGGGGVAISAGTNSTSTGTVVFSNANGVSFGMDTNGVVTGTVATNYQSQGAYLTTAMASNRGSDFVQATAAFAGTNASGTIASNGISVSVGNYITTAMASNRGTDFVQATAGFFGTNATGTIASNGISVSVNPQSAQPVAASASNGSFAFSTLKFVETNGITWATSTDGIRGSVQTAYIPLANSSNFAGVGESTTTTSGTDIKLTVDTNGVNIAVPPYITTYASQTVQPVAASASNGSFNFSTLKFVEGFGVTWATQANGIQASVNTAYIPLSNSSNFAGIGETVGTITGTDLGLTVNTDGVSIAQPKFITTYSQSVQTQASGNIAGIGFTTTTTAGTAIVGTNSTNGLSLGIPVYLTTAMASNRGSDFVQATAGFFGTNASGTIASNAISISVNAGGGGGVAISAGTNSTSTGTVVFSNGSGVTFGMNTDAVITASVKTDYLTTQTVQTQASGAIAGTGFTSTTTAGTAITAALGTNGLSMAVPNYITTYVNDLTSGRAGTGFTSTTTAGTAITAALGTNGLSMAVPQFLTTAMQSNAATISNINLSAGTTSNNLSAFVLSNSNGLAFGLNGSTVTGSYTQQNQAFSAAGGSSAFQTLGFSDNAYASWTNTNGSVAITELRGSFFAVSNTTQSSSGTQNLDAVSFAGAGGVSVGVSNGSVVISGATGGAGGAGTNTALALTNLSGTLSVNTNGISLSLNNLDDHFSAWSLVGNTVGVNSYSLSTEGPLVLQGGSNVTLSGNSNTIVISAGGTVNQTGPNIAAGGATVTNGTVVFSNSNNITFGLNGSTMTASYADPAESVFWTPVNFVTTVGTVINGTASIVPVAFYHNLSASRFEVMGSVSVATAANTSSAAVLWSLTAALYSLNNGTLSSIYSATTASEFRWQSNSTASVTGAMFFSAPLNVNTDQGYYWAAVNLSTRATGMTGAPTTSLGNTISIMGVGSAQMGAFSAHDPGVGSSNSGAWIPGLGVYSGTSNFNTIGLSNISAAGTGAQRADIAVRMRNT